MKRCILWKFFFVCFATFMVQNLPTRGRKTEKNKVAQPSKLGHCNGHVAHNFT
jgi:hypothetical protein